MNTVITKGNNVRQYDPDEAILCVSDIADCIAININGKIIVNEGNPITWPDSATVGLQAIVDIKAGTLRFGWGPVGGCHEFVVSEYVAPAPHIFDQVDNWPQQHRGCLGTVPLPEGWKWKWFGDDWILSNGTIGLKREDWFKYKFGDPQPARPLEPFVSVEDCGLSTPVHVLDLIKEWPTDGNRPAVLIAPSGFSWRHHDGGVWSICGMNGDTEFFEEHWLNHHENKKKYSGVLVQVGTKHDQGKPILGAVPPHAELAVGRVLTFGAEKYARGNWDKVEDHENRYMDAALRHLNAHRRGELTDSESGESHLAHAACCILFMLDKQERS